MRKVIVSNERMFDHIIKQLNDLGDVHFGIKGDSMRPFFQSERTMVRVKKAETYQKGDVVLFKYNDQVILHRIIKIKGEKYMMQGDATYQKEYAKLDDIYGKVVSFAPVVRNYEKKAKYWVFFRAFKRLLLKFIK